jgi:ABC-type nickel/cobalt efflux system permease component RcnA
LLPAAGIAEQPGTLLVLASLAALVGFRPIRFGSGRFELTFTHPMILCALAALGPAAAAIVALSGVIGSALGRPKRPAPQRLIFNVASVVLAIGAAAWAFQAVGGLHGDTLRAALAPLFAASIVYFLANTGLVAAVISLERHGSPLAVWRASFLGFAVGHFVGFTIACGLILFLQAVGPLGLLLGAPPCWILVGFYHEQRQRAEERQRRLEEVERLNTELDQTVHDLRKALEQVQQLEGLLPICMHCKKIRDGEDHWQQLEAYIQARSHARFTHSVCGSCRNEHYPKRQAEEDLTPAT